MPMPGTPLGMMYRRYMNVETLSYPWADAPELPEETFRVMEKNYRKHLELCSALAVDAFVIMDDTSTTVISPRMFELFNLDYTDRMAEVAHCGGKFYFHHSCGLLRGLLPLYRQTKMDAVHGFCVQPLGDVTLEGGRRLLGDQITIIAGLVQLFGPMDDREAVRESVQQMLESVSSRKRLILSLAPNPAKGMVDLLFILNECTKYQSR